MKAMKWLRIIAIAMLIGSAVFARMAWRPEIRPIVRPHPGSFSQALVAKGAVLAAAGYCASCHTKPGGTPLAGGRPMVTQFGTIYSTNITPDEATGIGSWSEDAFRRAMHEGVARDGSHLFPAFPYDHFSKLTDDDVKAIYAFLMSQPSVRAQAPANSLPFPLGWRPLQAGWKLLFFRPGRFVRNDALSPSWNRGAYLAEALGHCSACHTPRGVLGAEKAGSPYAGASIDGWFAPPLDRTNPAPYPWTRAELHAYLTTGVSQFHGTAVGPMGPVVTDGIEKLSPSDQNALVDYIASLSGTAAASSEGEKHIARALQISAAIPSQRSDADGRLYAAACASCHYNGGGRINPARPDLALNSAVHLSSPDNLIRVILYGVNGKDGIPGVVMPGFQSAFSDAEVARIAAYLRHTRSDLAPWADLEAHVRTIREQGP